MSKGACCLVLVVAVAVFILSREVKFYHKRALDVLANARCVNQRF